MAKVQITIRPTEVVSGVQIRIDGFATDIAIIGIQSEDRLAGGCFRLVGSTQFLVNLLLCV